MSKFKSTTIQTIESLRKVIQTTDITTALGKLEVRYAWNELDLINLKIHVKRFGLSGWAKHRFAVHRNEQILVKELIGEAFNRGKFTIIFCNGLTDTLRESQ